MGKLARLPVFYALEEKRVLVAANGIGAAWKAELLAAAGATVEVYAPKPGTELKSLAEDTSFSGRVHIYERDWTAADLAGAALAVGTFRSDVEAERFASAARSMGVPVNVIDKPAFCDFAFGSIVNRSPLVIGISTDGAAPIFGQAIRAKIEGMLPMGYAAWAEAAKRWRATLQSASDLSFAARRRFWQLFTSRAIAEPARAPEEPDYHKLLAEVKSFGESIEQGSVTLVGAGPGDPELLTLRAVRALQSADIILIDDLVSREVLDFARREARKMLVGKTGGGPSCKQSEINELMVSLAKKGKRVVRLKGGDPMIFGRAGEELEACRAAGIETEVVPGITAAQGVAGSLEVSLTHRLVGRRVQYITGHAENGMLPDNIDWNSIADPFAMTAIYMPSRTFVEFSERAEHAGLDSSTPAIAVWNATRPEQKNIISTLAGLRDQLRNYKQVGPLLILLGQAIKASGIEQDLKKEMVVTHDVNVA